MQRYSSNKPRPQHQGQAPAQQETFSQMANVTAEKSGLAGKLLVISLIVVSIAVTAFVGYAILSGEDEGGSGDVGVDNQNLVESDQYQAVFLSDGQIYFGKLSDIDREWVVLSRIFYLQVEQQVQPDRGTDKENQAPKISLAKLGNELHGPEDEMYIQRENILFWENLKVAKTDDEKDEGSRVVRAIEDYCKQDENKERCGLE